MLPRYSEALFHLETRAVALVAVSVVGTVRVFARAQTAAESGSRLLIWSVPAKSLLSRLAPLPLVSGGG